MWGWLWVSLAAAEDAVDDAYRVGPGDVLSVEVFGESELTRQIEVSPSGAVAPPLVGPVQVGGLTVDEVAARLMSLYLDGYLNQPQVAVRVVTFKSQSVIVSGTKKPGTYYLSQPTSLLAMIGEAGWIDTDKSSGEVVLRRSDGDVLRATLDDVLAGTVDPILRGGDAVEVQEGELVWIGGEVSKAGAVVWSNGLTASEALLRAGGPSETAQLRSAYVLRGGERIPVNLKRIKGGREADLVMIPDDRLYVPTSPF